MDSDAPLIVVNGPPGSGKTTLVAEWAAQRAAPVIWVSCALGVEGSGALWSTVLRAMEDAHHLSPEIVAQARMRLRDDRRAAGTVSSAFSSVAGDIVVVLDDYDMTQPRAHIDDQLCQVLSAMPQLYVVAIGRDLTSLQEAARMARFDVRSIGPSDLALSPDDTRELCTLHGLLDLDDDVFGALHRGCVLEVRQGIEVLSAMQHDRVPITLSDFVQRRAEAVRRGLEHRVTDERVRHVMALTSIPPYFSLDLARELTGLDTSEIMRATITAERMGYGQWSGLESTGRVFRYTALVREALAETIRATRPRRWRELTAAAARWFVAHGELATAVLLAASGEDWAQVDRLLPRLAFGADTVTHGAAQWEAVRRIPTSTLRSYPFIAFFIAVGHDVRQGSQAQADEHFQLAYGIAKAGVAAASPRDRLLLEAVQSVALRKTGRWGMLWVPTRRALDALAQLDDDQLAELGPLAPAVNAHLGLSALYAGHPDDAFAAFARVVEHGVRLGHGGYRNVGYGMQAATLAIQGRIIEARSVLERIAPEQWPPSWRTTGYEDSLDLLARALVALEGGAFTEAIQHLDALGAGLPTTDHRPYLARVRSLAKMFGGSPREALVEYSFEMSSYGAASRPIAPMARSAATMTTLTLVARRYDQMRRWLARLPKHDVASAPLRILVETLGGDPHAAVRLLARAAPSAEHAVPRRALDLAVAGAVAALRADRSELVTSMTEQAVVLSRSYGLSSSFAFVPDGDRAPLLATVRPHLSVESVDYLEHRFEEWPAVIADRIEVIALTARERAVLAELVHTGSHAAIAAALHVSVNTIKTQAKSLYRKLGASRRDDAIAIALERGLIEEPTDDDGDVSRL